MNFATWLDTLVSEKKLNVEHEFEVEGDSGTNWIPLQIVIEAFKTAPPEHQAAIKSTLIKIDFMNGDVMQFFKHASAVLAI